mmetsp:Transcript_29735/g.39699  ORF Transcript_29735/g.39699 Transcript_29735/m.39699 type:complete len:89 (+) Transcript_29735:833-1099(+)|eukprot:4339519-Ditylum_brightwellii.AAC.1
MLVCELVPGMLNEEGEKEHEEEHGGCEETHGGKSGLERRLQSVQLELHNGPAHAAADGSADAERKAQRVKLHLAQHCQKLPDGDEEHY